MNTQSPPLAIGRHFLNTDLFLTIMAGFFAGVYASVSATLVFGFQGLPITLLIYGGIQIGIPAFLIVSRAILHNFPLAIQLSKFLSVGSMNTLLDIFLVNILMYTTGFTNGTWFALFKAFSFIVGTSNAYIWNSKWTFDGSNHSKHTVKLFFAMNLIGACINVGTAIIIVQIRSPQFLSETLWANVAVIMAVIMSVSWNFISQRYIVFKNLSCTSL